MARKFKKKLALKKIVKKTKSPVLSVELVRKETLLRLNEYWKKIISRFKSFKLAK